MCDVCMLCAWAPSRVGVVLPWYIARWGTITFWCFCMCLLVCCVRGLMVFVFECTCWYDVRGGDRV